MKKRLFTLLIVLCLLVSVIPVSVFALTEAENNDTMITAQKAELNTVIDGSISVTGDVDFYKFELPQSGRLVLDMTSYMQYYCFFFYDANGNEMWASEYNEWNANVGFRSDSYTNDLAAGTYYLCVNGFKYSYGSGLSHASTGTYKINVSFAGANATEIEPNDSVAAATTLSCNGSVTGQIAINDRNDVYKITLNTAGRLMLDMTSYMQYYTIYVYDANGNELWYTDYNEWNASVGFRNDVHTLDLLEGTYYFDITGYRYTYGGGPHYSSTGTYNLKTSFTSANAHPYEPNNSVAEAHPIALQSIVNGQIAINDRFDYYSITLPTDRSIKLDMTSYMWHYTIDIYDANGTTKWNVNYKEWNAAAGNRQDIYDVALTAGTYYIKVTGYRNDSSHASTGTYTLALNQVEAPVIKTANVASTGKIKVSWDAVDGAAKYVVYRSTSKNGTYSKLTTTTNTSIVNSNITAGKTYYYYVRAVNAYDEVSPRSNISGRMCDLARPTVTAANVLSTGKIKLSWDAVPGAVKYEVYRSTSKTGTYTKLTTTANTSITNSNITAGKTYYYKVKAIAADSSANSAFSAVVSRTCDLARPTVTATRNSSGKPVISWAKVTNATKYKVYIYNAAGELVKTSTITGTKLTHTAAVAGKTYTYRVQALCSVSAAASAKSVAVSIKAR